MIAASTFSSSARRSFWLFGTLIVLGIAAPFVGYPTFLMKVLCFALFASAFNLLLGYGGLLSFGHAAFFGSAAYVFGWLVRDTGLPPELAVIAAGMGAGLLGLVIGALAIRRSGIYFAMVTLALAQVVYFAALNLPVTGREDGLQGIPRGHFLGVVDLGHDLAMYYFVLAIFLAGFAIIYRAIHSPFGQVLAAIRDNEARATSLGYDVGRYKLLVFTLSAALSGVAGATKALVFQLASLTDVHWHLSGEVVLMTLLGGLGTVLGPLVGAAAVVGLESELAGAVGPWVTVVIGGVFIVCVLLFHRGIVGEMLAWQARRRSSF